jgi:hypothetical protein
VAADNDPSDHRKAAKAEHVQAREIDQRIAAGLPTIVKENQTAYFRAYWDGFDCSGLICW